MLTTYRLKVSDLNIDLIKSIKSLFKKDREIEIIVHSFTDFNLNKPETKEESRARIDKAIENIEKGKNLVSFTEDEFDELNKRLLSNR